jgi:hypothetical protein
MKVFTRDRNKLKTLVHYVCWSCNDPAVLGAIKLNKVLWVSDLWAYVRWGVPITGEHYVKRQFGPVAPSIPGLVRELELADQLVVRRRDNYYGHEKVDYIALTKPDISCFTAEEISLIDEAIHYVAHRHTAMGISEKSHDAIWQLAELGEEIPYEAMLATSLGEVTPEDVTWARSLSAA